MDRWRFRVANIAWTIIPRKGSHVDSYDIVIVGGGMAGVATAYALTQMAQHLSVVLVEAKTIGHSGGSSYGDSRMYRRMYSKEYFSRMQDVALELWRLLERDCGRQLLSPHGLLFYGRADTGDTVQGSVPEAREVMTRLGIPFESLDSAGLETRWPMSAAQGDVGLFEPGAGSINASMALAEMLRLAVQRGLHVVQGDGAASIQDDPGAEQVTVTTVSGRALRCRRAVLTAGPWTNQLLQPLGVQLDLTIWHVVWAYYDVDPELLGRYPQWYRVAAPADACDGGLYYGFPAEPGRDHVKVGCDFAPDLPEHRTRTMADFKTTPDQRIAALMDAFLKSHWQGFRQARQVCCSPYTMTADGMFVLDCVPGHPALAVFAGGCGRAFKFAPLIGQCLACLALDQKPVYDITPLRMTRPGILLQNH